MGSFSAILTPTTNTSSDSTIDQKKSPDLASYSTLEDSSKKASISSTLASKTDMSSDSIVDQKQGSGLTFDTSLITALIGLITAILSVVSSGFGVFLVITSYIEKKKDQQQWETIFILSTHYWFKKE